MAAKMVSVRVPEETLEAIDYAADVGGVSRSVWMVRALESALADETSRPSPAGRQAKSRSQDITAAAPPLASPQGARRPSASSRASATRSGPTRIDTVDQVREWAMDRQRRLNAAKDRAS